MVEGYFGRGGAGQAVQIGFGVVQGLDPLAAAEFLGRFGFGPVSMRQPLGGRSRDETPRPAGRSTPSAGRPRPSGGERRAGGRAGGVAGSAAGEGGRSGDF